MSSNAPHFSRQLRRHTSEYRQEIHSCRTPTPTSHFVKYTILESFNSYLFIQESTAPNETSLPISQQLHPHHGLHSIPHRLLPAEPMEYALPPKKASPIPSTQHFLTTIPNYSRSNQHNLQPHLLEPHRPQRIPQQNPHQTRRQQPLLRLLHPRRHDLLAGNLPGLTL